MSSGDAAQEREQWRAALDVGSLYSAFSEHAEGLEACAAVEALIEISAIETLLAAFIVPLQGSDVKAEVRTPLCLTPPHLTRLYTLTALMTPRA